MGAGAPAGAKGRLRVSMCQIASASLRGEVDLGDLGAALLAEPGAGALVAVAVGGVLAGVRGRLDQRSGR
jgi:hypothetical protein